MRFGKKLYLFVLKLKILIKTFTKYGQDLLDLGLIYTFQTFPIKALDFSQIQFPCIPMY